LGNYFGEGKRWEGWGEKYGFEEILGWVFEIKIVKYLLIIFLLNKIK
jgi:hypothetical protein